MATTDKNILKNWFKTGLKPLQEQFWAWMDSYYHKQERIPITAIDDIENILNSKAEEAVLTDHLTNPLAHQAQFETKENIVQKGEPNGYAPLNEFRLIASEFLNIVDDVITGGTTSLLSAEQGKFLQSRIDAINLILTSDNINLDTVQELVDAIEAVQISLNTILVNDLTTGGTTKALTAEMGKSLQTQVNFRAYDTDVVHLDVAETILKTKTFSATAGNNIVSNVQTGRTGNVFVGQNNGVNTSVIDKFGNVIISGDIEVAEFIKGVTLKSPDLSRWRITMNNDGSMTTTKL